MPKQEITTYVQKRRWAKDDEYLIIEHQADERLFKEFDEVKVTIELVNRKDRTNRMADRIDGYDRDDLGESPDY